MKKYKYLVVIIIVLFSCINVYASNIDYKYDAIIEKNRFKGLNINVNIPEGYNDDVIIVNPTIFEEFGKYTSLVPGDKLLMNLDINNLSSNNYLYQDNSFILTTDSTNRTNTTNPAFDGLEVAEVYYPYRTLNKALKSLLKNYNYLLDDETIDKALKEINYSGIDDLYEYYKDYYGDDIETNYKTMMDIFNGRMSNYKESNKDVINLSFNFFYKKLLSFTFKDDVVTDNNSENYSIYSYMINNKRADSIFKNTFSYIPSKESLSINDMHLNINGLYTGNGYMNYNFSGNLSFKLQKEKKSAETFTPSDNITDTELVTIPNTRV